jgi:uncharacterized damage-inducible protein DinB
MRLHSVLRGAHAYSPADAALAGLTDALALDRPVNSDHSIAEIVAHMAFWQQWFLDRCDGRHVPAPPRAELGWPPVAAGMWSAVLTRFQDGFSRALLLSDNETRRTERVDPPIEFGPLDHYTIEDALIHVSLHNAHHLGQVITLRQLQGSWPPPAGRWTW